MDLEELNIKKRITAEKLTWDDNLVLRMAKQLKLMRLLFLPISLVGVMGGETNALIWGASMLYLILDLGIHRKQSAARHKQEKILLEGLLNSNLFLAPYEKEPAKVKKVIDLKPKKWLFLRKILEKQGRDYTRYKEKLIQNYIEEEPIKNQQILEIGCADGDVSKIYIKNQNKVFGSDISFPYLKQAKKIGIPCFLCNAQNLSLKPEKFRFINFTETIEHLKNPAKALNEINQTLKVGGLLILTTGNSRHHLSYFCLNPFILLENLVGAYFPSLLPPRRLVDTIELPFYHVRFSRAELIALIKKAGFKIEKVQTFGHLLSTRLPLSWIMLLEKPLFFIPFIKHLGSGFFIVAKKLNNQNF